MEPIRAKFGGVCSRTGQPYKPGALVIRLASGKWALAQDKSGQVKATSGPPPPEYHYYKFPDGKIEKLNAASTEFQRDGSGLRCERDGQTLRLVRAVRAEIDAAFPPEYKRCWECGREVTYHECRESGGDWNDAVIEGGCYCGC